MSDSTEATRRAANKDALLDKAKGHLDEAVGKVKEKVGHAVGNEDMEAEGIAQNIGGKARRLRGELKDAIHDAADKAKAGAEVLSDKIKEAVKKH